MLRVVEILLRRLGAYCYKRDLQRALALHLRGEVRRDGLNLTVAIIHLEIEWRARDIHPWDRGLLSPSQGASALFLQLALSGAGGRRPRVINVDRHPAYARAIAELKQSGDLNRRYHCRPSPYLN